MPKKWLMVLLLWFGGCLNYLSRMMPTTMHGSLIAAIPMSDAQFGLLTSGFLWSYGLLNPIAGYISDRYRRSAVIVVSMLVWSVATCLTAFAHTFDQLLLTRILVGISEASFFPAGLALVADYHDSSTRSFATGLFMSGATVGAALGGLGGWLAERQGWNKAFLVIGGLNLIYGVVLIFLLRDAPRRLATSAASVVIRESVHLGKAMASLFRSRSYRLAFCAWGLCSAIGWVVAGWMPTYLAEHFALGQGAAGFSSTGFTFSADLVGLLIGGAWADRWSRRFPRARLWVPIIGICAATPALMGTALTGVFSVAVFGLIVFGISGGFSDSNTMPILCLVSDPRFRATSYGVLNMASTVLGGLAIVLVGALRDWRVSLSEILVVTAGAQIIGALFLFPIKLEQVE